MHILTYNIFVHNSGGRFARAEKRVSQAKVCTRFQFSILSYINIWKLKVMIYNCQAIYIYFSARFFKVLKLG